MPKATDAELDRLREAYRKGSHLLDRLKELRRVEEAWERDQERWQVWHSVQGDEVVTRLMWRRADGSVRPPTAEELEQAAVVLNEAREATQTYPEAPGAGRCAPTQAPDHQASPGDQEASASGPSERSVSGPKTQEGEGQ